MGTGIAPPTDHPVPIPRVHLPLPVLMREWLGLPAPSTKEAVGLKSVAQLTLSSHFSGFQGITEVYNLVYAGIPNDHKLIPGNK